MTSTTAQTRMTPRWKAIFDELRSELAGYTYGSRFHTIAEVCQKFEVSTTTAIRVLNELSNAGLIEKIPNKGNVVRQVNVAATVHLLVPSKARSDYLTVEPIVRRLVQGLRSSAEQQSLNFHTLSEDFIENFQLQREAPYGFFLLARTRPATLAYLRKHHVPHVFLNERPTRRNTSNAHVNWTQSGYLAARHLIDLGHRRIAMLIGRIELRHFRERLKGFRAALREAGIAFRWSMVRQVVDPDHGREEVATRFGELLEEPKRPTAIVAATDYCAIYLLEECQRRGLAVPGDLSIVGYPNHPESSLTSPALTVVDAQYEKVAQAAVGMLLERILNGENTPRQDVAIDPELVIRSSTAAPPKRARSAFHPSS